MMSESARERLAQIERDGMKAAFASKESVDALYETSARQQEEPFELPESVRERCAVERFETPDGTLCFTLEPRDGASADVHVLYLHGGGFVMQVGEPHWEFAMALAEALSCKVTVPLYPLAPVHTYAETYRSLMSAYETVVSEDPGAIAVMGDSAGGNLAVAAGQLALQRGIRQPDLIVALSPLTDVAGELGDRSALDALDPMISVYGTDRIMGDWAGDAIEKRAFPPCVLHGPFEGLAPVLCFVGSREVLLPDSLELAHRIAQAGGHIDLEVRGGMWHTYPLMPETEEAREAFARIVGAVRELEAGR